MGLLKTILIIIGIAAYTIIVFMFGFYQGAEFNELLKGVNVDYSFTRDFPTITDALNHVVDQFGCSGTLFQDYDEKGWSCFNIVQTEAGIISQEIKIR